VIIDLTPVRDRTSPSRLLDTVEGRSKQVFKQRLADRPKQWRDTIEVVAMDGFTGIKPAATEEVREATEMMDPFHVAHLAADAPDRCRQRVQQATCGHRGRAGDPLYAARRTLHTGDSLLTDQQRERLTNLFAHEQHVKIEATRGIYQPMVAAYRKPDPKTGQHLMRTLTDTPT